MKVGIMAALAMTFLPVISVIAGDVSLASSANPSTAGQRVTFTFTFPLTCADGATVTFTLDGRGYGPDTYSNPTGIRVYATLSRTFTTTGNHLVRAAYTAGVAPDPTCGDSRSLTQRVKPQPSPIAPRPSPVAPSPAHSVTTKPTSSASPATASPTAGGPASGARVSLGANRVVPSAVKVGLAVLALTVAVVLTLPWLRRRGPG
ncbi:MAG: hypothetical protein E6J18_06135 [Chloroflexi bacterium]|nr:MAG: hypothetical protein E6J18_06135 [Chloroflexota bacterium]